LSSRGLITHAKTLTPRRLGSKMPAGMSALAEIGTDIGEAEPIMQMGSGHLSRERGALLLMIVFLSVSRVGTGETFAFENLRGKPYALVADDKILHRSIISHTRSDVRESDTYGRTCIAFTPKAGIGDAMWKSGPHTFAMGVTYTFYGRMRARKTGEKGYAFGFDIYEKLPVRKRLVRTLVAARDAPNMEWGVFRIGEYTPTRPLGWRIHAGIQHDNGQNVPEAWLDCLIAVPKVTPENESRLKEHAAFHQQLTRRIREASRPTRRG